MLGFNRRFDNEFIKVKQLVNQGAIGKPHLVKITSRDPQAPPINYVINSGGLFLDMTIHDFDMARFLVDKEVEEVYAKGAVLINPELAEVGDIDTAVITLTYQENVNEFGASLILWDIVKLCPPIVNIKLPVVGL